MKVWTLMDVVMAIQRLLWKSCREEEIACVLWEHILPAIYTPMRARTLKMEINDIADAAARRKKIVFTLHGWLANYVMAALMNTEEYVRQQFMLTVAKKCNRLAHGEVVELEITREVMSEIRLAQITYKDEGVIAKLIAAAAAKK